MNLTDKHRPRAWEDIIGQDKIVKALRNTLQAQHIARAYLFAGLRGTGKTSAARIYAKTLLCLNRQEDHPCYECASCTSFASGAHPDFVEIDAAHVGGINEMRERILATLYYQPAYGKYRCYLIDEAHGLSSQAANALLKTIEEPPGHLVFIFCTTEPERVSPTLRDRCWRFLFQPAQREVTSDLLTRISQQEQIPLDTKVKQLVADHAHGSYRNALKIMEQLWHTFGAQVTSDEAYAYLGIPPTAVAQEWLQSIQEQNISRAQEIIKRQEGDGFLRALTEVLQTNIIHNPDQNLNLYNELFEHITTAFKRIKSGIEVQAALQLMTAQSLRSIVSTTVSGSSNRNA